MQRDFEGHFWGPTERPSTYTNLRKAYKNCRIKDSVGPVTLKTSYLKNNWRVTLAIEKNFAIEVAHNFSVSLDILQYENGFKQLRDFLLLMKPITNWCMVHINSDHRFFFWQ